MTQKTELVRQTQLLEVFSTLADTLVDNYDLVEMLQTLVDSCASLLDVAAAGILLADEHGELDIVASTSEESRLVETMQLSAAAGGPCVEAFHTGALVSVPDLSDVPEHWRLFGERAQEQGFASVVGIPMRLRETVIGTLNLMRAQRGELNASDLKAAQALADVATIGILNERTLRESDSVRQQLQMALNSRVVIEQAKGVVAFRSKISTDEAFKRIRTYARNNGLMLSDVAHQLVQRTLDI